MRPCGSEISRAGPGWVSRSSSVRAIVLAPIAFRLPLDIQSVRITHTHCMDVKRTKAEQSEATRTALIAAARGLFTARGYAAVGTDRKSTRLNSSHANISYAVFCLKKK